LPAARRARGVRAPARRGGHDTRPAAHVGSRGGGGGHAGGGDRRGVRARRRAMSAEPRSYYGEPVIAQPVWTWEIPVYFFTGGMAGASAGVGFAADIAGNEQLARRAWAIALAGLGLSPILLISDLGRPARFLNMLRMFKVTSPMSVGSWLLGATVAASGVSAANSLLGLFPRVAPAAKTAAAALGMPVSTYTATLISNTALPVWHESRRELPFLF